MRTLKASLMSELGNVGKQARRYMVGTALTATSVLALYSPAMADNWTDHAADGITVDTSIPNTTNISQTIDTVKVHGDGDINAGWTVNVAQPSSSSKYILYDVEGDATYIMGNLNANGQIYIFNKDGVIFGRDSVVNVGSIIASTGYISDANLAENKLVFENVGPSGQIVLNGTINVANAGLAGFVAPTVINNGVINAKMGKVALASGEKVTLDLYGDDLVSIAVDDKLQNALVENKGTINASGGTVVMSAQAAGNAVNNVINMDGVIDVSSVSVKGGKIILSGGKRGIVNVAGKLKADGKNGGDIKITGQNVNVAQGAELTADAGNTGNGGSAYIYGDNYALFNGILSARGGSLSGNGGNAEISAADAVGFNGLVDLSAAHGTNGTLLIDPKNLTISSSAPSGALLDIITGGNSNVNINSQALADTLRLSNVNLWATETLSTVGTVDISTWNGLFGSHGITTNDLTLAAPVINIKGDVILGTGDLNIYDLAPGTSVLGLGLLNVPSGGIQVHTVNLNGVVKTRNSVGGLLSVAGDNQINSQADIVNVANTALIQQGVWFANDAGGATVNVAAGTYTEQVEIAKDLTLKGAGQGSTIIKSPDLLTKTFTPAGDSIVAPIVYVHDTNNVQISDLTVDGANKGNANSRFAGIGFHNAGGSIHDTTIQNIQSNPFDGSQGGNGIHAYNDDSVIRTLNIRDNTVKDFQKNGIIMSGAGLSGTVAGNVVTGKGATTDIAQNGIQISYGAVANVKDNTITGIGYSPSNWAASSILLYQAGAGTKVHHNTITGTGFDIGIYAFESDDAVISDNTIDGSADGIDVIGGDGAKVTNNNINNSVFDGIYVENANNATIDTNKVFGAGGNGIKIEDSKSATISSNYINNVGNDGIGLIDGTGVSQILSNYIGIGGGAGNIGSNGGGDGIFVSNTDGTAIQGNTIANTTYNAAARKGSGILVVKSDNTIIGQLAGPLGNDITLAGSDGIVIRADGGSNDGNIIFGNTIHGAADSRTGIYAEDATNTDITGNNVSGTGRYAAIYTHGGSGFTISSNTLNHNAEEGIRVENAGGVNNITNNNIDHTGENKKSSDGTNSGDAIHIVNASGLTVSGNSIGQNGGGIAGNGIFVDPSNVAQLFSNVISNVGGNGIWSLNNDDAHIYRNTITNAGLAGILVQGGNRAIVGGTDVSFANVINQVGKNGIELRSTQDARADWNQIGLIGGAVTGDGIYAYLSNDAEINHNEIANTLSPSFEIGSGIQVVSSHRAHISENTISHSGWDGVRVKSSDIVVVADNNIDGMHKSGIFAENGNRLLLTGNHIDTTDYDGIWTKNVKGVTIEGNFIGLEGIANNIGIKDIYDNGSGRGNGVSVEGGNTAIIRDNQIANVKQDGIRVKGVALSGPATNSVVIEGNTINRTGLNGIWSLTNDDAHIYSNTITNAGLAGILVEGGNRAIVGGTDASFANIINIVGKNGIELRSTQNARADWNKIGLTDGAVTGDGIYAYLSNDAEINHNEIANTITPSFEIGSGIQVISSHRAHISENTISHSGWDGIRVKSSDDVTVTDNTIDGTHKSGIFAENGNRLTLSANDIDSTDYDGIWTKNVKGVTIEGNFIGLDGGADKIGIINKYDTDPDHSGRGNGISVEGGHTAIILNNQIADMTQDGIRVKGVALSGATNAVEIDGNTIDRAGINGIEVFGNKATLITANTVNNASQVGILASGIANNAIKVALNTVTGGDIGMKFESGIIDLTGDANTISNNRVGLMFSTLNAGNLSLVDDDAPGSTPYAINVIPTNFAGTIGKQNFIGQTESYVELAGVAFRDTVNGVPFWINGLNSTYDGFTPPADGVLTTAEYDAMDSKVRDYFDGLTTGAFFFGAVPNDIDQSRLFRDFADFNGDITGLNIRILGLPRTGGGEGGLGANLNNITPFAGGPGTTTPGDLNSIETAAGGDEQPVQNPADIEPAAGEENTACWGDAAAFAGNGQAVNVVYSGSLDDALASAATCSTGSL